MKISVKHTLGDLEDDFRTIARRAPREFRGVVRDGIRAGNMLAKDMAKASNPPGSHSREYPDKFTAEMSRGFAGAAVGVYSGEYGPIHVGQGQLAGILEDGKGRNAPQNNLARSTDVIGPAFARSVRDVLDDLFWPKS